MKLSAESIRVLLSFNSPKRNSHNIRSSHLTLPSTNLLSRLSLPNPISIDRSRNPPSGRTSLRAVSGVPQPPLDLTEDNIRLVIEDAKNELGQLFDTSVGITGKVELYELDGPYVKISLKGRFWHKRSTVLARIGNYLKQRIPEILEVDIEDDKQLDDSPANF